MNLLNGNIRQLFIKYLFASMSSAVVMSIYSLVDAIALGRYAGATGTAVMAIVTPIWGVVTFITMVCGIGGAILMSKARGSGDMTEARGYYTSTFIFFTIITAIVWIGSIIFRYEILEFIGAEGSLIEPTMEYAWWIFMFFPVYSYSGLLAIFVRNDEAPNRAAIAVASGGIFNIFGDWFFVFVVDMGIGGAALATLLGEVIQNVILFSRLFSRKTNLKFVKPVHFGRDVINIIKTGFSAGTIDLANAILIVLFNMQILRYADENSLAVYGVICSCTYLFTALFGGVGQAAQPLISNNLGAGNMNRIIATLKLSVVTEIIVGIVLAGSGMLFPGKIVELFIGNQTEIIELAPSIIRPYFASFFMAGINIFAAYYFQCILKTKLSLFFTIMRGIVLSGILVMVLPVLFGGIQGVWWTMAITELAIMIIAVAALYTHFNEFRHLSCAE